MRDILKTAIIAILTFEAKLILHRTKPKIIGVTGNVGKTSTKDAIYEVLKHKYHARKSEKSFNTETGVPLTVLGLDNAWNNPLKWLKNLIDGFMHAIHPGEYPEILVLEMGVDQPGDMQQLTSWVKPDVVVITRLPDVPVHVEHFASPEAVVAEKLELVRALKPDGVLVYNHDDEKVRDAAAATRQQSIGYSRYSPSHFSVTGDQVVYDGGRPAGVEFSLTHLDVSAKLHVSGSLGVQHAYNYAAAAAVGSIFGIELPEAMAALTDHVPPPGRMRILRGIRDTLIIDDTYNSSPTAMERSLQALKELKGSKRKVAILGDMLELGQYSVREHEKVGESVADSADVLITVGIRARKIAAGALEYGMSEKHIYQYDNVMRARRDIHELIAAGDAILVKGSENMRTELLVAEIMMDTERKPELLVRQSPEWTARPVQSIV